MGSYSKLSIGPIEVSSDKNYLGNYGWLFNKKDKKKLLYSYKDGTVVSKWGYRKKLIDLVRLLEMRRVWSSLTYRRDLFNYEEDKMPMSAKDSKYAFEKLFKLDLKLIKKNNTIDFSKFIPDYDFGDERLNAICVKYENNILDHLSKEAILNALAHNKNNLEYFVEWRYSDIVEGGYCKESYVSSRIGDLDPEYLIITEGSSGTFVIKKAMEILFPDINMLFEFIDMNDNYPFSGTGNLSNFCKGLAKIKHQNKTLFIFDNDTEGLKKYEELNRLPLPKNLRIYKLPDLPEAKLFSTIGPSGEYVDDINGKAVSIELFLDLNYKNIDTPKIRWTSFDDKMQRYQGSLVRKDEYIRTFKNVNIKTKGYDYSKLKYLLESIRMECLTIEFPKNNDGLPF